MDCHEPSVLAMTVPFFVIASEAKQSIITSRPPFRHCERSEAIHKPPIANIKIENKKKSLLFAPFIIAKAEGLWQSITTVIYK